MHRALLMALTLLTACRENGEACPEPFYAGEATDEAWQALVDAEDRVSTDNTNAPLIEIPAEGEVFPKSALAPRFRWSSAIALLTAPRSERRVELAHAPSLRERFEALLWSTAHAHLPPITGDVYYLRLYTGASCSLDVMTTSLEWPVSADAWTAMQEAAGNGLVLDITSAYLTENRITEGPYKPSASRIFSVAP
jgi:hypothetical protein